MKPLPQKYTMGSDWLVGLVWLEKLPLEHVWTSRPSPQHHVLRLYCNDRDAEDISEEDSAEPVLLMVELSFLFVVVSYF